MPREFNLEDFRLKPEQNEAMQQAHTDRMLQFFTFDHLPENLKDASAPFCNLARVVVETYPANPERTVCLRKLLEAKDAAVRAVLFK